MMHPLILGGGNDISPSIYGHETIPCIGPASLSRDYADINEYHTAVNKDRPIVGICRGGQLINVLNGGDMVPHIECHTNTFHPIIDLYLNKEIKSNSDHHQMMVMPKNGAMLIASCKEKTTGIDWNGIKIDIEEIPEVIFYPNIKALAIQGHPEWLWRKHEFRLYCNYLTKTYLNIDEDIF